MNRKYVSHQQSIECFITVFPENNRTIINALFVQNDIVLFHHNIIFLSSLTKIIIKLNLCLDD